MKIKNRKGGAAIELALGIPIIFAIVLGSVELANMVYFKQNLTDITYQATLLAMRPSAQESDVEAKVQGMLGGRNITNATVSIEPNALIEDLNTGDLFTVSITANNSDNSIISTILPQLQTVESTMVARKQ